MNKTALLLGSVYCLAFNHAAFSDEISVTDTQSVSFGTVLSSMGTAGGDRSVAWEVAPSYSELFGLGVRTAVGTQLSDGFAIGAIIDIAEHREEYLANAGVQLNDSMRIVATAGLLKEREEFVLGEGRESVQQYEYGLSLKGNYDAGAVRGFEVNAYQTNGSSDTDTVETGDLTGLQIVTQLQPSERAAIRLGAGYERAEWEGGDVDQGFTLQAIGSLEMSDALSLNYAAKSAETENTYGLGLTYDMSTSDVRNSSLSVDLNRIEGKHGISDDTRVALNWTVGFGAVVRDDEADASVNGPIARPDLLQDVISRPAFLPKRVLARVTGANNSVAECANNPSWNYEIAAVVEADSIYPATNPITGLRDANFEGNLVSGTFELFAETSDNEEQIYLGRYTVTDGSVTLASDDLDALNVRTADGLGALLAIPVNASDCSVTFVWYVNE